MDVKDDRHPRFRNVNEGRKFWEHRDLGNDHITKARQIQTIQDEQVYLKRQEHEENRKSAMLRGIAAANQTQLQQLKKEEPVRVAEAIRQQNSLIEKDRARKIARLPPPPQELPFQEEQRETADFYDTNYMGTWTKCSNEYQSTKSSSQGNAVLDAVLSREQQELNKCQVAQETAQQNEAALLRYKKAREREKIVQTYDSVLDDLEAVRREEIARKQKALTMNLVKKQNGVHIAFRPGSPDDQKKLEKQVEMLFFPIEDAYGKGKLLLVNQERKRRQEFKESQRPESPVTQDKYLETRIDGPYINKVLYADQLDESSPSELNKAVCERWDDSLIFSFEDLDQKEDKITMPNISRRSNSPVGFIKEEQEDKSLEKFLVDASTQTFTTSPKSDLSLSPPLQEGDIVKKVAASNVPSENGGLKLGTFVTLPVVSDNVSPYISQLIQKAASKMFSPIVDSGVEVRKLPTVDRNKFGSRVMSDISDDDKENLTPTIKDRMRGGQNMKLFSNLSPTSVPSLAKPFKTSVKVAKESAIKHSDSSVKMKRKVIRVSPPVSKSDKETEVDETDKPVPTNSDGHYKHVDSDELEMSKPTDIKPISDTVLLPLESKLNVIASESERKQYRSEDKPSTNSFTYLNKICDEQKKITNNYQTAHKSSHASYFCNSRLFTVPSENKLPDHSLKAPTVHSSPDESTSSTSNSESQVQKTISEISTERASESSEEPLTKERVPEITLPNYLRHSLESELKHSSRAVTTDNIQQLLEQFAAFERLEGYIRPPPPVSFPVGIQGTENVVPHELSTIIEVDTPQTSLVKSVSKSYFDDNTTSSFSSVQITESESGNAKENILSSAEKLKAGLSPSLSIPSSLSTWSSVLKMYSPSASTTSSQLSEAFSAEKIRTHSTPVKRRPEQSLSYSNLLDQSITLVDGFSLDSQADDTLCSVNPSSPSGTITTNLQQKETENGSSYLGGIEVGQPLTENLKTNTGTSIQSSSDSLLSFLAHEYSSEKYFNLSGTFF